ncbi:radical SAM/SPASM domain-containing protein [Chamaesiphon sp. VAR_48_metabat_403]|uniref:radical SAM/SPASM domain-containing protein n=1 Tax=Chamaesiphon sp. VAR_48_metabat_403 TaxID=2964700 RepID=UPI00286DED44|nr:radical SAM protein [Chamaesiphon sp. VAR_48_metabat_403]
MTVLAVNGQATDLSSKQDSRFSNVDALIIKVTKRCNLDCEYCYENITKSGDVFIATFQEIAEKAFYSSSKNTIEFIFHGGEPTLLPDSWYTEAFQICQTLEGSTGKKASLSIQTNLTHLTDRKLELFRDNKVSVGASLDGSATLIASMRPGAERVIKNFLKARENGLRIGVLMTINHSNFDKFKESTEWLFDEMDVKDFKANVVYSVGAGSNIPDLKPEQIFQAHKAITDYMIESRGQGIIEHNLIEQIDWFCRENSHETKSLCGARKCGAGSRVLGITSDGNLLPCGRFKWDDSDYFLGDLANFSEFEEFERKVDDFHALNPENWFNCNDCSARKICGFGCQAFISRSNSRANVECLSTKMLYNYFLERESDIFALHQALVDKNYLMLDSYDDSRYGDGAKEPYRDTYEDKYRDGK